MPPPLQVKRLAKLREQGRFRREEGAAVLAGAAPVRELCGAGCVAEGALRTLLLLDVAAGEADWHREYLSHFPPGVQASQPHHTDPALRSEPLYGRIKKGKPALRDAQQGSRKSDKTPAPAAPLQRAARRSTAGPATARAQVAVLAPGAFRKATGVETAETRQAQRPASPPSY